MNQEQAKLVALALNPHADKDLAVGALEQAADEILCIEQAISFGAVASLTCSALIGVAERLRAAARLAGDVELALDARDKPEAAT